MPRVAGKTAVGAFDNSSRFDGPSVAPGSSSMTAILVFMALQRLNLTEVIASNLNAAGGWSASFDQPLGGLTFTVDTAGTPTTVTSATDFSAFSLPGLFVWLMSYDNVTLRSRFRGQLQTQGAASAITASGGIFSIGDDGNTTGTPAPDFTVAACMYSGSAALDATGLASAETIIKDNLTHGRSLNTGLSSVFVPEFYWDAEDWDPATMLWPQRVGASANLTQVGALELFHSGKAAL